MNNDQECELVYQDEHLVVVNKPSGLLVHRSPIDRHETRFALQAVRNQLGRHVYPVHRLDKPTSGLLLFGLSPQDASALAGQFAVGTVRKRYLAVARGHCPEAGGTGVGRNLSPLFVHDGRGAGPARAGRGKMDVLPAATHRAGSRGALGCAGRRDARSCVL